MPAPPGQAMPWQLPPVPGNRPEWPILKARAMPLPSLPERETPTA